MGRGAFATTRRMCASPLIANFPIGTVIALDGHMARNYAARVVSPVSEVRKTAPPAIESERVDSPNETQRFSAFDLASALAKMNTFDDDEPTLVVGRPQLPLGIRFPLSTVR